jgi:hypothetical protein
MQLSTGHHKGAWLRVWAVVGSVAALTIALLAVVPGAANAESGYEGIYLSNPGKFMYAPEGVVASGEVAVGGGGFWFGSSAGYTNEDGISGTGYIFDSIFTSGDSSGLCIADTDPGGIAELQICNADGTVFIPVKNGDGSFLYSRYFLNRGEQYVLAVYLPGGDFAPGVAYSVNVVPVSELNSNWWYRWSFESVPNPGVS